MDGCEDDQLTPFLKSKKLLNKQEQSLVVTEDDLKRFMSLAPQIQKSPMARIFRVLCGDAVGMKTEEFMYERPQRKGNSSNDRKLVCVTIDRQGK